MKSIALVASLLFSTAVFAQQGAPRPGDPDRWAPRAGDTNPYAPKVGAPNPYATRAGDPVKTLPEYRQRRERRDRDQDPRDSDRRTHRR